MSGSPESSAVMKGARRVGRRMRRGWWGCSGAMFGGQVREWEVRRWGRGRDGVKAAGDIVGEGGRKRGWGRGGLGRRVRGGGGREERR